MDSYSLISGVVFHFMVEKNEIALRLNPFTGMEQVIVNGVLVKKQRVVSSTSVINFQIDGNAYRIDLLVKNVLKGPVLCTLYKSEVPIRKKKLVLIDEGYQEPAYTKLWFIIIVGVLLGVVRALLDLPIWFTVICLVPFLVFVFYVELKYKYAPKFVEEDIDL